MNMKPSDADFNKFIIPKNMVIDREMLKHTYTGHVLNACEKENWSISTDHCYARPWNWQPECSFLRPTKTLFIPKATNKHKSVNPLAPTQDINDDIDIETVNNEPVPYDTVKAKQLMEECERNLDFIKADERIENWEELVPKQNWTPNQTRLFNGVVNILNNDHLARLACSGLNDEAICRRTTIDKSVQRMRRLISTILWDQKLLQWLHELLIDSLSRNYLAIYIDILQTLKSKLPSFIDKMLYASTTNKLINDNLTTLLKRPWDPVFSSLMQDKPKKLPGNPIIVIVPSSPVASARNSKWINLLTNLATVVNVPFNFGTPGQRMTLSHCADQMFASIRGKIQEIRTDYPGRNVVLLGFNAGATMSLQIAQVEPVLCVVCVGFSLLTAEGRRGEPDDNLMELQCPVLFVIGQCSTTSLQEDVEDLRERMRVETGLIVVGAADNYLRVNKEKKKAEGITQSVVDRCIVDEIGEFISGIILSPFPPQIRQSPTHVTVDSTSAKKSRSERKRYNSTTSSLDSEEPPSPTPPRVSRPVGRPPGSKSKPKLEAKWAAQVAQGIPFPNSPSPNTTPPHTPITPDTSSNDSSFTDKSFKIVTNTETPIPIKKIKTLKPVAFTSHEKFAKNLTAASTPTAKMQAYGLAKHNIVSGTRLSTLLQGGIKTIPPTQPRTGASTIKVLENVTLNTGSSKILSNTGRTIDLSKITVLNSISSMKSGGNSLGNVVLLPDGKIKTIGGNILKGTSTSLVIPSSVNSKSTPLGITILPHVNFKTQNSTRYITSKKQLIGNKPPKPIKKNSTFVPSTLQNNLPPPTNLTTQDIMDLPIIFADDNQLLENPIPEITQTAQIIPRTTTKLTPGSKFVLVNKPVNLQSNYVISQSTMKKPIPLSKQAPKYTKIILSKRTPTEEMKSSGGNIITKITNLAPEISLKKISGPEIQMNTNISASMIPLENIDLEAELVATAVPKPNYGNELKNITILPQKMTGDTTKVLENILREKLGKRSAAVANITGGESQPKTMKIENN